MRILVCQSITYDTSMTCRGHARSYHCYSHNRKVTLMPSDVITEPAIWLENCFGLLARMLIHVQMPASIGRRGKPSCLRGAG